MTIDWDEELSDTGPVEYKPLDLELMKKNMPDYSSQKLCEMIVCDRYFGCFREVALMCMEELSQRRLKGDDFKFEQYIEDAFKTLPELNNQAPNLRDVLQQAIGRKGK